jgi:hypothetical protein
MASGIRTLLILGLAAVGCGDELGGDPLPWALSRENPIYPMKPGAANSSGGVTTVTQALSAQWQTAAHGGNGGGAFDWPIPDLSWRLGALYIRKGLHIDSIEAWWQDPMGNYHFAGKAGGNGGTGTLVILGPSQEINWASGRADNTLLLRLELSDTSGNWVYQGGPTAPGSAWDEPVFTLGKTIHGFHGRSGQYVDKLGFYAYSP